MIDHDARVRRSYQTRSSSRSRGASIISIFTCNVEARSLVELN
jgi:hypothetical protein